MTTTQNEEADLKQHYKLILDLVLLIQKEWKEKKREFSDEAVCYLLNIFKPLLLKICSILWQRYPSFDNLLPTIESFFLELVTEYNIDYLDERGRSENFKGVFFCRYIKTHLLFRVEKFILAGIDRRCFNIEEFVNFEAGPQKANENIIRIFLSKVHDIHGDMGEDIALMLFMNMKQIEIAKIINTSQPTISHFFRNLQFLAKEFIE